MERIRLSSRIGNWVGGYSRGCIIVGVVCLDGGVFYLSRGWVVPQAIKLKTALVGFRLIPLHQLLTFNGSEVDGGYGDVVPADGQFMEQFH
jgi:hypothetical protein